MTISGGDRFDEDILRRVPCVIEHMNAERKAAAASMPIDFLVRGTNSIDV